MFRVTAEKGHGASQRLLAVAYEKSQGAPVDVAVALTWYQKAANHGDALAQLAIGKKFAGGEELLPDYVQAYKWFTLAASALSTESEKEVIPVMES